MQAPREAGDAAPKEEKGCGHPGKGGCRPPRMRDAGTPARGNAAPSASRDPEVLPARSRCCGMRRGWAAAAAARRRAGWSLPRARMRNDRFPPLRCHGPEEPRAAGDGARGAGGLLRPGQVEVPVSRVLEKYVTKREKGAVEGAEAARRRGRAGALGWGRRTPGISPCPPPPNPGGITLVVVPTPGKRRAQPTCGAGCARGAGSALSPRPSPFTCRRPVRGGGSGAWGGGWRWRRRVTDVLL